MTVTDSRPEPEPSVRADHRPEPEQPTLAPTLEEELAIFLRHEKPERRALLERGFRTGWNRHVRAMEPVFARHRQEQERWDMAYHQHLAAVGGYVTRMGLLDEELAWLRARVKRLESGTLD